MLSVKPQVVYLSDEQELTGLVRSALSERFEVTVVAEVTQLDDVLRAIRQIKPDYVIVDPQVPSLDHDELGHRMRADAELSGIQILIVREDV
jgi:DNA-binding response OmpR family regulator